MSLCEKVYLALAMYFVLSSTVNMYLLMYKIKIDTLRRKEDEARRNVERIQRENQRRENMLIADEMRKIYYDILGGKYDKN